TQTLRQFLSTLDLCAALALVVLQNKCAIVCGQLPQAFLQTGDPDLRALRFLFFIGLIWRDSVERFLRSLHLFEDFKQQQPCNAEGIGPWISNVLSSLDLPGDAIECFISVVFRKGTPTPLKKTYEMTARLFVSATSPFPVIVKRRKQLV